MSGEEVAQRASQLRPAATKVWWRLVLRRRTGMPRCSESMSMSLSSKSEMRSCDWFSNMKVIVCAQQSAARTPRVKESASERKQAEQMARAPFVACRAARPRRATASAGHAGTAGAAGAARRGERKRGRARRGAHVGLVIRLERDNVVVVAALEHLAHRGEVDAQRDVAVAPVVVETVRAQQQRHERDVARVLRWGSRVSIGCGSCEAESSPCRLVRRWQERAPWPGARCPWWSSRSWPR